MVKYNNFPCTVCIMHEEGLLNKITMLELLRDWGIYKIQTFNPVMPHMWPALHSQVFNVLIEVSLLWRKGMNAHAFADPNLSQSRKLVSRYFLLVHVWSGIWDIAVGAAGQSSVWTDVRATFSAPFYTSPKTHPTSCTLGIAAHY
jgi:hypothetical protein